MLRALVTVPLVLPPMVGGVALLFLFGRTGWLGGVLAEWGIRIPFTTTAVVLAQTFVALPFLVLALEGSLRTTGVGYEQTAAALGAGRWTILAPRDAAARRARPDRGRHPVLRPRDRRVRRDGAVRRQRAGRDADHAARDLHGLQRRRASRRAPRSRCRCCCS